MEKNNHLIIKTNQLKSNLICTIKLKAERPKKATWVEILLHLSNNKLYNFKNNGNNSQ